MTVAYVGNGTNTEFIPQLAFRDYGTQFQNRTVRPWNTGGAIRELEESHDLVVRELAWPYHRMATDTGWLSFPDWLNQRVTLQNTWAKTRSSFRRNVKSTDLRLVRKFGLSCEIGTGIELAQDFYANMYLPYSRSRFNSGARLADADFLIGMAADGLTMHIKRNGLTVAGAVLGEVNGNTIMAWNGIPAEFVDDVPRGAFSALYYYTLRHAYQRGCGEVDFCGTRPIANDGVYRYKRKWGSYLTDGWSPITISIKAKLLSPPVLSFLSEIPFIVRSPRGLEARILWPETALSQANLGRVKEKYGCPGLRQFVIFVSEKTDLSELANTPEGVRIQPLNGCPSSDAKAFFGDRA